MISSLEGVKVGDMLAWDERIRDAPIIARVDRLTPKHAVAGKVRWRIIDGLQAGSTGWDRCWARIAMPDDLLKARAQKARNYARSKFDRLTDDQAIRVADFIHEMLKESTE